MGKEERNYRYNINLIILIMIFISTFLYLRGGPESVFGMSIEEEAKLGRQYLEEIKQQVDLVDDGFAEEYINDLGNYLIRPLETKPFTFNFYIIADPEINAFAIPGGHIFIYTGLIDLLDYIDEFAGVICHEIAHVSLRHISKRAEKGTLVGLATMAGVLAGALAGGEAGEAIIMGSMAAGQQKMLSYSREDERQADQIGFTYASKSGFDPSAMISTLTKLQQGQWGINEIPAYLLTHPMGPERMANIESLLASYSSEPKETEKTKHFRKCYALLRTILKAKYLQGDNTERYFKAQLEKDPDSSLAHLGIAIVLRDKGEYTHAIDHFQKAMEGLPEQLPALRYLSETYQLMGENREAIKILEKALKLNDKVDKSTLFLLAISYQNLEEYSRAAEIYERLTSMEPVKDEIFYNLGMTYGRQDRLGLAHYNFGIYYKRLKRIKESQFHFQKAKELAGDDSVLQQKIKEAMEEMEKNAPVPPMAAGDRPRS